MRFEFPRRAFTSGKGEPARAPWRYERLFGQKLCHRVLSIAIRCLAPYSRLHLQVCTACRIGKRQYDLVRVGITMLGREPENVTPGHVSGQAFERHVGARKKIRIGEAGSELTKRSLEHRSSHKAHVMRLYMITCVTGPLKQSVATLKP